MVNTCVSYVLCRVVILVYVAVLLRGLRHVARTVQDAPRTIGTTSQQTETQVQTIDNMNHSRRVGSRQHVQAKLMTLDGDRALLLPPLVRRSWDSKGVARTALFCRRHATCIKYLQHVARVGDVRQSCNLGNPARCVYPNQSSVHFAVVVASVSSLEWSAHTRCGGGSGGSGGK